MKIAGLKNQSAWFRYNKFLRSLTPGQIGEVNALLQALPTSDAAYDAIIALLAEVGADAETIPENKGAWINLLTTLGIPLQLWMGRMSYSTYTESVEEPGKYIKNYEPAIHAFGRDLRKAISKYKHGLREVFDLMNHQPKVNNPGGLPDGVPVGDESPA